MHFDTVEIIDDTNDIEVIPEFILIFPHFELPQSPITPKRSNANQNAAHWSSFELDKPKM